MLKFTVMLVAVALIGIIVALAMEAEGRTHEFDSRAAILARAANPPDRYATETFNLIDAVMNDYDGVRDFRIDGQGRSAIVTLIDSDFKVYEMQGPRPTWHKLVHEVIEEWQGGQ